MDDLTIDFAEMTTTTRTPEESAARRARMERQDRAASIAYRGALSLGQTEAQAKRAAVKARNETT